MTAPTLFTNETPRLIDHDSIDPISLLRNSFHKITPDNLDKTEFITPITNEEGITYNHFRLAIHGYETTEIWIINKEASDDNNPEYEGAVTIMESRYHDEVNNLLITTSYVANFEDLGHNQDLNFACRYSSYEAITNQVNSMESLVGTGYVASHVSISRIEGDNYIDINDDELEDIIAILNQPNHLLPVDLEDE